MAMRGRSGRGNPNRPPRLIVSRVYEQFKPMSERRQEDDYDTLLVYLPGFQKEYIKVTTEDLNIVRVRGERLVTENKWSRFQEDFRVPQNCEMRGIRARFDSGILTITMPRKIINAPPTTTTTTQDAPKTEEQPFKRTKQEEALQKPKEELKEKKPEKPISSTTLANHNLPPQPIAMPTSNVSSTKQEQPKEKKPEKPKSSTTSAKNNLPPQPIAMPASNVFSTKQEQLKTTPEANESSEEFRFGSLPTSNPEKADKHDVVEKPIFSEKTDLNAGGKGKHALLGDKTRNIEGEMGKSNDSRSVQGGRMEENEVVGRRGLGVLNEDRKVLVNVGVGVLVIVALGVHVSYTIGLIGSKGM